MKKQGFTLIELMVVVAVIAILATLSVTSFSAAIKRTRNAGRQSDIQAVAKGLETCYDVASGTYTGLGTTENKTMEQIVDAQGPFEADTHPCINEDIITNMETYPYAYAAKGTMPQAFVLCAQLEKVANWGSVGNVADLTKVTIDTDGVASGIGGANACTDDSTECWFCTINQQ